MCVCVCVCACVLVCVQVGVARLASCGETRVVVSLNKQKEHLAIHIHVPAKLGLKPQ